MYAIIIDGGRQYRVSEGDEVTMDYRDAAPGSPVQFGRILAFSDGSKLTHAKPGKAVEGAAVTGEVIGVVQGDKLVVQKFRRRKNSRRRTGHRQLFTRVRISSLKAK